MEKIIKIFESAGNAIRLVIAGLVAAILYFIFSIAYDAAQSVGRFFKSTEIANYTDSNLVAQEDVSEIITSQAKIDIYSFHKKNKDGTYSYTGETFSLLAGEDLSLGDKVGGDYRQYCQSSVIVTFGYKNPQNIAKNIFSEAQGDEIYLPEIIGKFTTKKISSPPVAPVISMCQKEHAQSEGLAKLKATLIEDEIYKTHLQQGVSTLASYLKYVAHGDETNEKFVASWQARAMAGVDAAARKDASRYYQQLKVQNIKLGQYPLLQSLAGSMPVSDGKVPELSAKSVGVTMPELPSYPNLTMGTYMETYATIAYSHVNESFFLGLGKDNEYAIQRDVIAVVYGVEAVSKDPSVGNEERIVASAPEIIYRDTKKSELGLFNDTNFENFVKVYKEPVDKYMAKQVEVAQEAAIAQNSSQAKRAARRSFEYQLAENAKRTGKSVSVRYLDIRPEAPSLYDSVLQKYAMFIGGRISN